MGYMTRFVTRVDVITMIIQSCILVVVIAKTIKLAVSTKKSIFPFFFALAISSYLLSNFYWIAFECLKPETRIPMACNEISECAMILLLCAGLESILKDKSIIAKEIAFAVFYIGANIALWIAWSGEWFQDILFGIPYVYFLWLLIRGLKSRGCMSQKELWLATTASIIIFAMQIPQFFAKGNVFDLIEGWNFVMMFALTTWLGIISFRRKDFFLASTFFFWTELFMFLSGVPYYYMAFFTNTVALLIMYSLVKKEVAAYG